MKAIWMGIAVAFAAVSSTGCGTVGNLASGDFEPWGGLKRDANFKEPAWLRKIYMDVDEDGESHWRHGTPLLLPIMAVPVCAELCATGIGDTVTLPLTMSVSRLRGEPLTHPDEIKGIDISAMPVQYSIGSGLATSNSLPEED